nr:hypothetical protein [Tanacetum cinerariifolium]
MRTKPGVDTLSFDDLYNNLRVFESDVKGSTASSSGIQNVAFVSSDNTSSTNEVSTAYGISTSSDHNSQRKGSSSYTDDLITNEVSTAYGISTSSGHNSQRKGSSSYTDDLIDGFEMATGHDFYKIEEVLQKDKEKAGTLLESADQKEIKKAEGEMQEILDTNQMSAKDKSGFGYGTQILKGVLRYENEVNEGVFDSQSSDVEDSSVNDRFTKVEGMHAVPPLMTEIYMLLNVILE